MGSSKGKSLSVPAPRPSKLSDDCMIKDPMKLTTTLSIPIHSSDYWGIQFNMPAHPL